MQRPLQNLFGKGHILNEGKPGVNSSKVKQFLVITSLHNLAMMHDKNLIGVANSTQPVGDDKTGTVRHQSLQGFLDQFFRRRIDTGSSLIQNQDRRIL